MVWVIYKLSVSDWNIGDIFHVNNTSSVVVSSGEIL